MRFPSKRRRFQFAETIKRAYFAADVWVRETTMSSGSRCNCEPYRKNIDFFEANTQGPSDKESGTVNIRAKRSEFMISGSFFYKGELVQEMF